MVLSGTEEDDRRGPSGKEEIGDKDLSPREEVSRLDMQKMDSAKMFPAFEPLK